MSRFTHAAATMHALSLAAMEEASRFGVRDADIDHLLLALTIDPDTGGQILRGMGAGLDAARAAVATQHAAQLGLVGIASDADAPGRIVFHVTGGYEWTDRAIEVWKEASSGGRRGDSAAVLRALVDEPSGLVEAILRRLDIDPDALKARLDDARGLDPLQTAAARTDAFSGTRAVFVPASLDDVWALLSSATRIPEWDEGIVEVGASDGPDGPWEAQTRTTTRDGKPMSVREASRRQQIHLARSEDRTSVTWRFTYPDSERAVPRVITFALEHAAGGMQLRVTLTWEAPRRRRSRRILRALLSPLLRFIVYIQLTQIESGVTRVFR